eukprot:2028470-Rhodomonas_salina.1
MAPGTALPRKRRTKDKLYPRMRHMRTTLPANAVSRQLLYSLHLRIPCPVWPSACPVLAHSIVGRMRYCGDLYGSPGRVRGYSAVSVAGSQVAKLQYGDFFGPGSEAPVRRLLPSTRSTKAEYIAPSADVVVTEYHGPRDGSVKPAGSTDGAWYGGTREVALTMASQVQTPVPPTACPERDTDRDTETQRGSEGERGGDFGMVCGAADGECGGAGAGRALRIHSLGTLSSVLLNTHVHTPMHTALWVYSLGTTHVHAHTQAHCSSSAHARYHGCSTCPTK